VDQDLKIEISKARPDHVCAIQDFIRTDWKEDHIFVKSRKFFNYQYFTSDPAFYLAINDQGAIVGLLGYINYGPEAKNSDIYLSLWKVRQTNDPSLGMKLLQTLITDLEPRALHCGGIAKPTIRIYRYLGYSTGKLTTSFFPNRKISKFEIAEISSLPDISAQVVKSTQSKLVQFEDIDSLAAAYSFDEKTEKTPYKSRPYIDWRYFKHPVYDYKVYGVLSGERISSYLVTRTLKANGKKSLRIVDFVGEEMNLRCLHSELTNLVQGYEFIEFTHAGMDPQVLREAGFLNAADCDVTIPLYYEPFLKKNIEVYYFTTEKKGTRMCLGDGDQDRPNIWDGNK